MSYLKVLANDKNVIIFRPEIKRFVKNTNATILLQQIIYWAEISGFEPFYKFIEPCSHESYRDGDSWCEELAFSKKEFLTAAKILKDMELISSKTNRNRVTFYTINTDKLEKKFEEIYGELSKVTKGDLPKCDNALTKVTKGDLHYSKNSNIAETNTETTHKALSSMATDGKFNALYSELRFINNKYLGSKQSCYSAYLQVKAFLDIKILSMSYKKYHETIKSDERAVGLATFIENDIYISFLPDVMRVIVDEKELIGTRIGDKLYLQQGGELIFTNDRFIFKLRSGEIEFLDYYKKVS